MAQSRQIDTRTTSCSFSPPRVLSFSLSPMTTSKHNHKDKIPQSTARPTYTLQSAETKRKCKRTSNETHRSRTQGRQTKKKHGHYYTNGQRDDSHMVIFRKHTQQQTTKREREREKVQRPKARKNLRSRNGKLLHETEATTMTTMKKCKTVLAARGEKTRLDWSVLNIGRAKSFRKRLELGTLLWDLLWDPLL